VVKDLAKYLFALGILLACFIVVGFNKEQKSLYRFSGYTMGTSYDIQFIASSSSVNAQLAENEVAALLRRLDREVFSTYSESSELTALNQTPVGDIFIASDDLIEVLRLSDEIRKLTLGAFDITVGPLVDLWGFGSESDLPFGEVPTQEEIRDAKSRVGAESLVINQSKMEIVKKKDIQIDLSAVAKGYSVDEVASLLDSLSLESYFIEVGGEIKMKGLKLNDEEWITAIETPSNGSASIFQLLANRGKLFSIAGSGNYRNYFEVEGIRYSHEIDPRSGHPISHQLAAAFVISESAAEADALATAFMILGLEESKLIIEDGDIPAFLITRNSKNKFKTFVSSPFSAYLID
tara:strand:+ start:834 stop:1883 length:1050 start_codon:yes stop_codon:yes gene_type:complete